MYRKASEIEKAYLGLKANSVDSGTVQALRTEVAGIYLAINDMGDFLCLVDDKREISSPPRKLKAISVDYGLKYKAIISGDEYSGKFTILKLRGENDHLLVTFASLLAILLEALGEEPTPAELQEFVENFIELFTPRAGDPRERLKGLFGELAVIYFGANREQFVQAWHESSNANKDFSFPSFYLEVKTTEGKVRNHEFSSKQLESPFEGKPVIVASLVIEEDPQGKTVFQLLDSIQTGMNPDLQLKLIREFFEIVGLDAEDAHEIRWQVQGNVDGIQIFKAEEVPKPVTSGPDKKFSAISNVSFSINFEILQAAGVEPASLSSLPVTGK